MVRSDDPPTRHAAAVDRPYREVELTRQVIVCGGVSIGTRPRVRFGDLTMAQPRSMRFLHHSEVGGHAQNEDASDVRPHPLDADCLLCVLADGQGGRAGGAAAARLACQVSIEQASHLPPARLLLPQTWSGILKAADDAVAADPAAKFTTLIALAVWNNQLRGASSGDSAAVLLRAGGSSEILTARQRKNPPVGAGGAAFAEFAAALTAPWMILAMSDGVWKYAGWESILRFPVGEPGEEVIRALRQRAALPGTGSLQDDFTLIVVQEG